MSNEIGLGEFIAKVKDDLEPTRGTPIFFLEKAELEIHFTVSKEVSLEGEIKGKADLKINVLGCDLVKLGELEASGKPSGTLQRQDIHTVKITLVPLFPKEEIMSDLDEAESKQIKKEVIGKTMRGMKETEALALGEVSQNQVTVKKVMRG